MPNAYQHVKAKRIPIVCKMRFMTDDRPPAAIRLEQARRVRGFADAKAASKFFGWSYPTYIQHESGERGIVRAASKYAKAFRVSEGWLLTGEGRGPDGAEAVDKPIRIVGRVGADPSGAVIFSDADDPNEYVPIAPGGSITDAAVEVRGSSMHGWANDGSLLYFSERSAPTDDYLGEVVICGLDNGEVLVKRLLRGSEPGYFDLESINGPTRSDVRVEWIAEITAIIPPRQARRILG